MTTTLTARRLITHDAVIEHAVLDIAADGLITAIGADPHVKGDDTLTAAFLDVHTHGALGHDVMTAAPAGLEALARFYAQHGVAHWLPTTVTASIDDILKALNVLADAIEAPTLPGHARPVGIHLEGPFLSHAKRGVHAAELLQTPSPELFDRFQTAARGHIRLLTVAPELPDAAEMIRHTVKQGVRVSIGHTNANTEDTLAALRAGATSATHTFNAMRALDHRDPGVLGIALTDDRLFAELIADGIHVAPELTKLWLRAKGDQHAILITDSMSATGMPNGSYSLAGMPVTVLDGRAALTDSPTTLAGSVLTMDRAVHNLAHFTGAPLATATRLASHNPAAMLGDPDLTTIAVGRPANLNRFNARGTLTATYLRGRQITR